MLQFTNVSKTFSNGYLVLSAVNFSIAVGEWVLLTGPSGSGKTTIFKLLLRLLSPSSGNISIKQRNIAHLTKKEIPYLRRYIGMVSQNPLLLPHETIFENVAIPLIVAGYCSEYIKIRVTAALKKVGLLNKSHVLALDLSSGEQKRAEVARAIVTTPQILLVDEPTANVDATTAIEMLDLFKTLHRLGMTVIIATHEPNLLNGQQTKTLIIHSGKILQGDHHVVESFIS
ncbi:MAG: hypothetical protein A3F10_01005 [Coxiella sp. RIFCSPHIGHO2_12_FULL_42_15]|nr:MAG: hypothetical protein A3F10_01005 [Coxiella sp. RIFCSPHIGHO2_12_FULL_42_15]